MHELAYYDVAVQYVSHNPEQKKKKAKKKKKKAESSHLNSSWLVMADSEISYRIQNVIIYH